MSQTERKSNGVANIRAEFVILKAKEIVPADDDLAERNTNHAVKNNGGSHAEEAAGDRGEETLSNDDESANKKVKLSGAARKQAKRAENRKAHRGQNKARKFGSIRDQVTLCTFTSRGRECKKENCRYMHSVAQYLSSKPADIYFPRPPSNSQQGNLHELTSQEREEYLDETYSTSEPYLRPASEKGSRENTFCPVLASQLASSSSKSSQCNTGWACRFLGSHIRNVGLGKGVEGTEWELRQADSNEAQESAEVHRNAPDELNWPEESLQKELRSRRYFFYRTKVALKRLEKERLVEMEQKGQNAPASHRGPIVIDEKEAQEASHRGTVAAPTDAEDMDALMNEKKKEDRVRDAELSLSLVDNGRLKPSEKRRLDWFHDELYLAPLTTTGNLPFRRLCSSLGADITCGEMGLAESYLQGQKNEWSLVRRWEGERCFGTQLCGNKPELLLPAAEVLARQFPTTLDFIDVNCGCPIDLVYKKGAGSALLDHPSKLGRIVRGMSAVSGDIPITIKLRTGTSSAVNTTHKWFPRIKTDWDAAAVTLHGRSRQQRYKNRADWNYIKQCTEALRQSIRVSNEERPDEEWVHPIPIYGNGDVYSWQDYQRNKELTGVDGQMLARGALIKPWLFTEIKESRTWDISSRERLDLIRQLTSYGLTHWGSDTMGVNTTRRFVCESISFTHRYIPVGILETVPVQLNERPPPFKGRDELETLLASGNAEDWVKITEMFLGKAPDEFHFIPKHKSNSYENDAGEDQG